MLIAGTAMSFCRIAGTAFGLMFWPLGVHVKEEKNTTVYVAYEDFEGFDPARPEKNLLRAVLISAMSDLRKRDSSSVKAREFFLGQSEEYLFSFQSICNLLELDPKLVLMITGLYPKPEHLQKKIEAHQAVCQERRVARKKAKEARKQRAPR